MEDKGVDVGGQPPETEAQQPSVNQDGKDPCLSLFMSQSEANLILSGVTV